VEATYMDFGSGRRALCLIKVEIFKGMREWVKLILHRGKQKPLLALSGREERV